MRRRNLVEKPNSLDKTVLKEFKHDIAETLTVIRNQCQRMESDKHAIRLKMNFWRYPVTDRIF